MLAMLFTNDLRQGGQSQQKAPRAALLALTNYHFARFPRLLLRLLDDARVHSDQLRERMDHVALCFHGYVFCDADRLTSEVMAELSRGIERQFDGEKRWVYWFLLRF